MFLPGTEKVVKHPSISEERPGGAWPEGAP